VGVIQRADNPMLPVEVARDGSDRRHGQSLANRTPSIGHETIGFESAEAR